MLARVDLNISFWLNVLVFHAESQVSADARVNRWIKKKERGAVLLSIKTARSSRIMSDNQWVTNICSRHLITCSAFQLKVLVHKVYVRACNVGLTVFISVACNHCCGRFPLAASQLVFCTVCNVQLADEIMLISIISLIFIFAHAPVQSNLIYTKHAQWH